MDGSVQFLLEKISALLTEELSLPKRVNQGIMDRKFELENITASLKKNHESAVEQDDLILLWVRNVQDVADDIDNVLDRFSYYQTEKSITRFLTKRLAIHSIEEEIDRINSTLKNINQTTETYLRTNSSLHGSRPSMLRTTHNSDFHPRVAPLYLADADVVGFEEDKDVLVPWALDMLDDHKIIFVVGMGGSGKTTLVKQVFEAVKGDFDCYAWISVSKSAKKLEILWNLLDQLCNQSAETTATPWQQRSGDSLSLINKLLAYLQDKRYVIVLDDLWIDDVWESIKFAFPKHNSSRIIITTRRGDIANSSKDTFIDVHNVQHLPPEEAKKLFHRKAFPRSQTCPPTLAKLSKDMLTKSEGLPLAILEIGQLLSTKGESVSEWQRLHDSLASELKGNGRLSNIRRVLILSYNDLPYHLKNCFLLMNTFPPNYPIQRRKLIQLWIAEGFIKEENNGKEFEDVGEEYLNELIERSLIQVKEKDFDGRPRTLRVHNIVREIVHSELQDVKFCKVYQEQGITRINFNDERIRRISIHKGDLDLLCPNLHTRALLIFDSLTPYQLSVPISYSSLKDLRILHLEGANLDKFPAEIEELLLLRYLCLRNTRINSIPKSIGNLKFLETLDLKQTSVRILPKEICRLNKLRNLLVYRYNIEDYVSFDTVKGFEVEVAGETGWLANLRKLSFVQVHKDPTVIIAMQHLTKMRKLGIIDLRKKDGRILCETIQMLKNLHCLNVTAETEKEILDMQEISRPPPLQRLYLKGRLERMPIWISKLHDLKRLRLKWSRLDQQSNNPIESLQDLPNLLELQLYDAYDGNQLDFNSGKFMKLKILEFELLRQLKMVIMETNTLPCLQKLIIRRCGRLRQIPVGIEKLGDHLKEIHLYDMPQPFVSMLQKNGGSLHHLVHRIPLIRSHYAQVGGPWVWEDLS